MKLKNTITAFAFSLLCFGLSAQDWDYGVFLGPAQYQGDLSKPQITWPKTRLQGGLFARYNLTPSISFKGAFFYGRVTGDDKAWGDKYTAAKGYVLVDPTSDLQSNYYWRHKRNLNFYSNIWEISAQVEYNLKKFIPGSKKYRWTPYLLAGIGFFHFNPKTELDAKGVKNVALRDIPTESDKVNADGTVKKYSLFSICIPTGIGFKYNLGALWSVGIEIAGRKTFTDWIDDVHHTWVGEGAAAGYKNTTPTAEQLYVRQMSDRSWQVTNPNTGTLYGGNSWWHTDYSNGTGSDRIGRGDPKDKDTYIFTGITISKTIRKYGCTSF